MAKICPKCKAENKNSADFCENCGELFPESSTSMGIKPTHILRKIIPLLIVLSFLGFLFSGTYDFEDTTSLGETFQSGGLTFNYPDDWQYTQPSEDTNSNDPRIQELGTLYNSDISLYVSGADLSDGVSVEAAKEATKENIEEVASAEILGDDERTVDGVTVYEITTALKDQETGTEYKSLYIVTGIDNQVVYFMEFIAEADEFENYKDVMDSIIGTIRIE